MLKLPVAAILLTAAALGSPAWQARGLKQPPIVSAIDAPAGTETFAVKWIRLAVQDLGVMVAAVARPSGTSRRRMVSEGRFAVQQTHLRWADGSFGSRAPATDVTLL
jgi:hypothetical protein